MATRYNYTGGIVTDGLVLHLDAAKKDSYPGSGTTWTDLANGATGTLTNGPTYTGVSKDASIVFDGSNDYVTYGNSDERLFPTSTTVDVWVKVDAVERGTYNNVFRNGSSGIEIQERNDGYWRWYVNVGLVWSHISWTSDGKVTPGDWLYVAGTYNEITGDQIIYGNGVYKGQINRGTNAPITYASKNFVVGNHSQTSGRPLDGNIGVFRVYNRALTASEITQNYNALKGRYGL